MYLSCLDKKEIHHHFSEFEQSENVIWKVFPVYMSSEGYF